jgi:hypothetical protein
VIGKRGSWLYEVEGGPQFGRQSGLSVDHAAGFCTVGLGRELRLVPWSLTAWLYYDYATGQFPGGSFNRFNQLFPLAHKYLGFVDAVGRSNIQSPNVLITARPNEYFSAQIWYHYFMADARSDNIVGSGGTPP